MSPTIVKRNLHAYQGSPIPKFLVPPTMNDSGHVSQRTGIHTPMRSLSLKPINSDREGEIARDIISSIGQSDSRSPIMFGFRYGQVVSRNMDDDASSPVKIVAHRRSSPNIFKGLEEFEHTFGTMDEDEEEKEAHSPKLVGLNKQAETINVDKLNNSTSFLNNNNVSTITTTPIYISNGKNTKTDAETCITEKKLDHKDSLEKFQPEFRLTKLESTNTDFQTSGKKRWSRVSLLFQSMLLLNREEVNSIKDADDILGEINNYNLRTWKQAKLRKRDIAAQDFSRDAFELIRRVQAFCECACIGSPEHINLMKRIIDEDPKKFMLEPSDPSHLLNHKNHLGQTPLYIAAKHGNLEVVKLLIAHKVNYQLESEIDKDLKINETPFLGAIKWNHSHVVEYMLENCELSSKEVFQGLRLASANLTKQILKRYIQNKFKGTKKLLFCCFSS